MSRPPVGSVADEPTRPSVDDVAIVQDALEPVHVESDEHPGPGVYGFPSRIRWWPEIGLVVGVNAIGVVLALRLWRAHFGVPFSYSGDGLLTAMGVKTIREHGWILTNPRIGAPFHGQLYDFPPGGENIHWLTIKVLGLVTPSWIATENVYFLATFFLVALSAYFVARYLRFGVVPSLVAATLYAFLPYHLAHGEAQVARAGYYAVPLGALIVLWVVDYRTRFFSTDSGRRLPLTIRRRRWIFALAVCAFLGASDTQNTAFIGGLLALVAVLVAFAERDPRPLVIGGLLVAVMFGSLAVNNSPSVLYRFAHGKNTVATDRALSDQDTFGLSLSGLVLPTHGHFFPPFAHLEQTARTGALVRGEDGEALGLIGAVGLLTGFLVALSGTFRRTRASRATRRRRALAPDARALVERFGVVNLAALLIGTAGGLSFLLAVAGFKLLRSWNRMAVVIGFFALLTVAVLVHAFLDRWRARGATLRAIGVAVAALLVFGLFDQNASRFVPQYASNAKTYTADHAFFGALEQRLPRAAMVFQYPVVPFPEAGPTFRMGDYEHFAGFLNSKHLRFSYGAIKGRPESDWQAVLGQLPVPAQLAALSAVGFDAIEINRSAYVDDARALEAAVQGELGAPLLHSGDARLVAYDLTAERRRVSEATSSAERASLSDAVLHPVTVTFGDGFYDEEGSTTSPQRWAQRRSTIVVDNLASHRVDADISATVTGQQGSVTVDGPGLHDRVPVSTPGSPWRARISLPPGRSTLRFVAHNARTYGVNDARVLFVHLGALTVWPTELTRAVCTFAPNAPQAAGACPVSR